MEFMLSDHKFPMPVGRIEYLDLGAMTFTEFLRAVGQERLAREIEAFEWPSGGAPPAPHPTIHRRLLELLRVYHFVGGMPEAVKVSAESENLRAVSGVHASIIDTWRDDFPKYAARRDLTRMLRVFNFAARHAGRKVKYSNVSPDDQSATIRRDIDLLVMARVVAKVTHSQCSGLPLQADLQEKVFKLIFLDVGLMNAICGLGWQTIAGQTDTQLVNAGPGAEQFIGQHLQFLLAKRPNRELTYWLREGRSNNAEVDYVCELGGHIVPIEVKAGRTGTLKSLHQFVAEKQVPFAVRFDADAPALHTVEADVRRGQGTERVRYRRQLTPAAHSRLWGMRGQRLFLSAYACSGAASLLYQVVWTRLLTLQLGHTVAAVGAVLAAFMGGLAAGALIGGHLASRLERAGALRMYAVTECVIALCALALPFALHAFEPLLAWAYGDQPGLPFALVRLVSSLALVFVPAAAMGITFPLAIRWFAGSASNAGRDAGGLYALNTAGAAAGALLTGFVLIPAIGLRATTVVGIGLNLTAATVAWLVAHQVPSRVAAPRSARRARAVKRVEPPIARWSPAIILGVSGFIALVYEVTFTRALALALGPTTYAFAAMLTAFISGIAIGAALSARMKWTRPRDAPMLSLGLLMVAAAAAASVAGWFAGTRLPLLIAETVASSAGPGTVLALEALYAVGVLLPLSCILGAVFPIGAALVTRSDEGVARDVSLVYGINTIGAVAGSLGGAFILLPLLGLQQTLRVAGMLALGAGCLAFVTGRLNSRQRMAAAATCVATAVLVFATPAWDIDLLSSGGYTYAANVDAAEIDLATSLKSGTVLYYKEGATATVSVRRLAGTVALAIDGKVDASNWADMLTQKLLAHLPLLLHPDPHDVCIIGLGSGVTLGAALRHEIDRADVVEISQEVVEASSFFADDNEHALEDSRTRLILGDGRSHLQLSAERYEVVISQPSNPWMAGVAPLFTREFFLAARDRLRPGGIFCQWAHTYDIADADLRSIAATFTSVFPNGTLWLIGEADVLFIGSNDTRGPILENISLPWRSPGIAADLGSVSVFDPFSLLSLYVAGPRQVRGYGHGALLQTDDRPMLEFSGPRAIYDRDVNENVSTLRTLLDPAGAPAPLRTAQATAGALEWRNRGQMLLRTRAHSMAYDAFVRSVALDPGDETALAGLLDAAGAGRRLPDAQRVLETTVAARPGSSAVRLALARLLAATGAFDAAVAHAEEAIAAEPDSPRGLESLASILGDAGDADRLRPVVTRMQEIHPEREETVYYAALASFLGGDLPDAIARAREVIRVNPHHAAAHNLMGAANATLGFRDRAREAFRASLDADPRDPGTYTNLAVLEMESGNQDAAVAYFAESLSLDPGNEMARAGLAAAGR